MNWQPSRRHGRLIPRCSLILMLPLCGCVSMTEWRPFDHAWAKAQDAEFVEDDIVGAWAGPWLNESSGKEGVLLVVIQESESTGYQAWAKVMLDHPIWGKGYQSGDTSPWILDMLLHAEPQADGTVKIGGRAEQTWMFGRREITCHGTADGSELTATFERGDETGRVRLRRIEPCPGHWFAHVPGIGTLQYSPPELREQLLAIENISLDAGESESSDTNEQVLPASFEE